MPLLSLNQVSLAFGHHPLLSAVECQFEAGERVCLVGRNGTGKSTLFRVISGEAQPDDGEVWHKDTLRISHLEQDVPVDTAKTIFQIVSEGLGEIGAVLVDYHDASLAARDNDPASLTRLADLQHRIEVADGWNLNQKVETVLSKLILPADRKLEACSGGVRRRVMLAKALVSEPDLLLLDEPTNHMDIAAINWLEEYLLGFQGALIFITHDRTFLRHLATRIIELDRGRLTSFNGDFDYYLRRKDEMADAEMKEYEQFDKKLAEHEAWIRKGVKARRTRNQGRVRALESMRAAKAERMSSPGNVNMTMNTSESSGKLVADVRHVNFSFDDHEILRDFSTRILRGDRVGVLGPNGAGKSTLLKILLGQLKPQQGQVVLGTKLEIAYFDQQRDQLELDKTVKYNISQGHDYINVRGHSRHVISYLKDFLFPPDRIDTPVRVLSGGERNRLLLARIFTQASNMLVLDEPTNDLDVDTLELLEELLSDYEGTIILVSHDRTFLDNLVTSTIVFEGDATVTEYVGGYEDYIRQRRTAPAAGLSAVGGGKTPDSKQEKNPRTEKSTPAPGSVSSSTSRSKKKLSYKEKRELEVLPEEIEKLEHAISELENQVSQPDFYQQDKEQISGTLEHLDQQRKVLEESFQRWEYLDQFDL